MVKLTKFTAMMGRSKAENAENSVINTSHAFKDVRKRYIATIQAAPRESQQPIRDAWSHLRKGADVDPSDRFTLNDDTKELTSNASLGPNDEIDQAKIAAFDKAVRNLMREPLVRLASPSKSSRRRRCLNPSQGRQRAPLDLRPSATLTMNVLDRLLGNVDGSAHLSDDTKENRPLHRLEAENIWVVAEEQENTHTRFDGTCMLFKRSTFSRYLPYVINQNRFTYTLPTHIATNRARGLRQL